MPILYFSIMLQIVSYTADDDGYHATVQYQGEAHYDYPHDHKEPHHDPKSPDHVTNHPSPTPHHPHLPTLNYPTHKYKYSPTLAQYEEADNAIEHAKDDTENKKYKYSPVLAKSSQEKSPKHHKSYPTAKTYKYSPLIGSSSQQNKYKNMKYKTMIVLKQPKPSLPHYTPMEEEDDNKETFKQKPAITLEEEY